MLGFETNTHRMWQICINAIAGINGAGISRVGMFRHGFKISYKTS
jgi:hypothetical protein